MFFAIGGIVVLLLLIIFLVIQVNHTVKSKEENKFLCLYKSLSDLKKTVISCKPTGRTNNSYSQGKATLKAKTDSLNQLIIDNIKIFSDYGISCLSDYLIQARNKVLALTKTFYIQIESIVKDKKEIVSQTNNSFDSIFSAFSSSNNDEDLSQKGVNYFDKIDNDMNSLIDEIIINLIIKYSSIKKVKVKDVCESKSFISWIKSYLVWQKLIPIIVGIISSFGIGLLVNYISSLIF